MNPPVPVGATRSPAGRGKCARVVNENRTIPKELDRTYSRIRPEIEARLSDFDRLWAKGPELALFEEMAFCLFTPQSKAFSCWAAVERLRRRGLLMNGSADRVASHLAGVRFHHNKARYLVEARRTFAPIGIPEVRKTLSPFASPIDAREWLVKNVKGYGYKEASHFLRNIGRGRELAILDRHILRNLASLGVIDGVPSTLSRERYLRIEKEMARFSASARIPIAHLDFLLWHKEAGAVFK